MVDETKLGVAIAVGAGLGILLGVSMDEMGLGLAIGIGLGVALGVAWGEEGE